MANLVELYRDLKGKEREITVVYASARGRNILELSERERFELEAEIGEMIEEAEEGYETAEVLRVSAIGRLILERREIERRILDELEERNDDPD
jgi:hypothetical protein